MTAPAILFCEIVPKVGVFAGYIEIRKNCANRFLRQNRSMVYTAYNMLYALDNVFLLVLIILSAAARGNAVNSRNRILVYHIEALAVDKVDSLQAERKLHVSFEQRRNGERELSEDFGFVPEMFELRGQILNLFFDVGKFVADEIFKFSRFRLSDGGLCVYIHFNNILRIRFRVTGAKRRMRQTDCLVVHPTRPPGFYKPLGAAFICRCIAIFDIIRHNNDAVCVSVFFYG